ncbi:acyl-CoA thioesterase [Pseudoalteromonas xiamenensis]|jgi:acyl-CoA thioester hydrolase|uniref:Acyl-CoA thioesterase n=1 Tax=Pseudoalteromonas xiamenensis TaxID=882626 RepID=A0A975DJ53_9GAMM|nr:thioesterase family protein [Pseudoalteromonas xiamenensis]QTH72675.1 acyl-CoA thioesterase [Pseudoalteromonas xiamenensis]
MYKLMEQVHPRFSETDALGHINNTVVPVWFEAARTPIFKIFTPNLDPKQWKLIIAKIEVEFKGELFYGEEVEIRTGIERIGNSSYVIVQEAWQGGRACAVGKTIMVRYSFADKSAVSLSEEERTGLSAFLI